MDFQGVGGFLQAAITGNRFFQIAAHYRCMASLSVTYYSTWADVGQGADTGALLHTHEALRPLGIRPDQIRLVRNDTGVCPDTGSASGSRSHHASGLATLDAARQLLGAMRKKDGTFRTWQEMTDAGLPTRYHGVYASN